jgi:hypothetical protein
MLPLPTGILAGIKIFGVIAIISSLGYGVKWTYDKHLEAIDNAINQVRLETAIQEQRLVEEITHELELQIESERLLMQAELSKTRATSDNLRRMLSIDHDLDRLLQRKPGLVLPRVNKGTEEVLRDLEELTR